MAVMQIDPKTGRPLNVPMPGMPMTPTQAGYTTPTPKTVAPIKSPVVPTAVPQMTKQSPSSGIPSNVTMPGTPMSASQAGYVTPTPTAGPDIVFDPGSKVWVSKSTGKVVPAPGGSPVSPVTATPANTPVNDYSKYANDQAGGNAAIAALGQEYNRLKTAGDMAGANRAHEQANAIRDAMGVSSLYDRTTGAAVTPTPIDSGKISGEVTTLGAGQTTPTPNLYQDPFARSSQDIATLAKNRIDAILAAGRTSAKGALAGAKTAYDYTNQIEGDNRILRNSQFQRQNDPRNGRTNYLASTMFRGDAIDDTHQDSEYNNNVSMINQKLADLETAAPGQEQQIIDDLQQIERQTGISVAQLQETQRQNQINNSRNASNDAYDQSPLNPINVGRNINNQLDQLKLEDYPAESKAAAQQAQLLYDNGKITQDTLKYNLEQLKDPNSPTNQVAKLELQMKQIDAKNYSQTAKLELQKLQKTIADIGKVHTQPQTAAEIAADKVKLAVATKELVDIANGKYPSDKETPVKDHSKDIDRIANMYVSAAYTGAPPKVSDPIAMRRAIIALDMDDEDTDRYIKLYGLPFTDEEVKAQEAKDKAKK